MLRVIACLLPLVVLVAATAPARVVVGLEPGLAEPDTRTALVVVVEQDRDGRPYEGERIQVASSDPAWWPAGGRYLRLDLEPVAGSGGWRLVGPARPIPIEGRVQLTLPEVDRFQERWKEMLLAGDPMASATAAAIARSPDEAVASEPEVAAVAQAAPSATSPAPTAPPAEVRLARALVLGGEGPWLVALSGRLVRGPARLLDGRGGLTVLAVDDRFALLDGPAPVAGSEVLLVQEVPARGW